MAVSNVDDELVNEARKYKSAEEFADSNKMYH